MKSRGVFFAISVLCFCMAGCENREVVQYQENAEGIFDETEFDEERFAESSRTREKATEKVVYSVEAERDENWSLDNQIDSADVIFEGICQKKGEATERGTDMMVLVKEVLCGVLEEDTVIQVRTNEGDQFREGEKYIIFGIAYASVYEQKELFWFADAFLPGDLGKAESHFPEISGISYANVVELIKEKVLEKPVKDIPKVQGGYCSSDVPEEIFAFSDCVVKVTVSEIYMNSINDRTSYMCSVSEVLKGTCEKMIRVISFKESLDVGESYVLYLMGDGTSSYTMSALNSIFPIE